VQFGTSPNDAGFRLRGVGTAGGFSSASEQNVGTVVDNVVIPFGNPVSSLGDLERVEVLKGPQGTQFGKNAEAIAHLEAGLKDSPGKQQLLFQLGSVYIAQSDFKKALVPLELAFTEEPNYDLARTLYAAGLYYDGQTAKADQLLTEKFGSPNVDSQPVIQALYTTKKFDRLAKIYQTRLDQNPNDVQSIVGHAILNYFATGDGCRGSRAPKSDHPRRFSRSPDTDIHYANKQRHPQAVAL